MKLHELFESDDVLKKHIAKLTAQYDTLKVKIRSDVWTLRNLAEKDAKQSGIETTNNWRWVQESKDREGVLRLGTGGLPGFNMIASAYYFISTDLYNQAKEITKQIRTANKDKKEVWTKIKEAREDLKRTERVKQPRGALPGHLITFEDLEDTEAEFDMLKDRYNHIVNALNARANALSDEYKKSHYRNWFHPPQITKDDREVRKAFRGGIGKLKSVEHLQYFESSREAEEGFAPLKTTRAKIKALARKVLYIKDQLGIKI